jgi:hypothetical protein
VGGVVNDLFIIKNLLLYLGDSVRTWLEHLPRGRINDWTDLHRTFVDNIQGTYARPSKQWELHICKQKLGESLHDYIRRFPKHCTKLLGAIDKDAISAFQNGTTCTTLIHHLGQRTPRTTRELLDIATNHADSEEAVAATLNTPQGKGKQVMDNGEGPSSRSKKKKKNDKHHRDNNLIAAVKREATCPKNNPPKAGPLKDHFEKLLDALCTHHEVPVKHALKDCRLMKNYINDTLKPKAADPSKKVASLPDNDDDDAGAGYPSAGPRRDDPRGTKRS